MQRARRSTLSVLILGFALLGAVGVTPFSPPFAPAAVVGWPASQGAVIAEVVTGGTSASDEFIEVANAGSTTVDLQNVELIYISAAGTTPTRKVSWATSRPLAPGQHLLVANSAGAFAVLADVTYASGIAATGGAIAIRVIGGTVIDAVGWGDATNAFVEGAPAAAPAASSSIERRPGGSSGNATDTNDNASDFLVQVHPVAQNLGSPPVVPPGSPSPSISASPSPTSTTETTPTPEPTVTPDPTASPTASSTPGPTESPDPTEPPTPSPTASGPTEPPVSATAWPVPTDTPAPTDSPTPTPTDSPTPAPTDSPPPTPEPTATPEPSPTPDPTATPAPSPTPESPTPSPTGPSPTPEPSASPPTPTPSAVVISIADARGAADGSHVTVEGVLTTVAGAFDGGRGAFLQDETGGIGLYFDSAPPPLPAGTLVRVTGALDQRYRQTVLRPAPTTMVELRADDLPEAVEVATVDATEPYEGLRVTVQGTVTGSISDVADGVSFSIDDGSGPVRVIVGEAPDGLHSGLLVRASGPLGQHDSSGTGSEGYRVYALEPSDLEVIAPPSPSPTPSATPTPSPSPSAVPSPSTSATPSGSASPTPSPSGPALISINAARGAAAGTRVHVRGVVVAEVGRVGASLVSIQDASGGLAVHLPAGAAAPSRGTVLDVTGDLAAPYGQLEIRPDAATLHVDGSQDLPAPIVIAGALDESLEGLLAAVEGVVAAAPTTSGTGDVTFDVDLAGGARVRILADVSSGVTAALLHRGSTYGLVGVVGQHASASGRLDGYRIWLRGADDVVPIADPSASPSASASPSGGSPTPRPSTTASASPSVSPSVSPTPTGSPVIGIAAAILAEGTVAVRGTVTAGTGLLQAGNHSVVIQDSSAAILVRLPAGSGKVGVGRTLEIVGRAGRSYGAPRILATTVRDLGSATLPPPLVLTSLPTAAVEWRLVRVTGLVESLHRKGEAWVAEIRAGATLFLVDSLKDAKIKSDRARVGATVTVTGIAKRPHPAAKDRRYPILPRNAADVVVERQNAADTSGGPAATTRRTTAPSRSTPATTRGGGATTGGATSSATTPGSGQPLDVDLVDLPVSAGRTVRVGGLIVSIGTASLVLDDGTATATADVTGDARAVLSQLQAGLAINLIGKAVAGPGARLTVTRAEDVIPVADPAASAAASDPAAAASTAILGASVGPGDAFSLSDAEDVAGEPAPASSVPLLVGLLLGLALVGVVALLLSRRQPTRLMAHPLPGTRE